MNRTEYLASIYSLARSLVIHSPITAQRINDHLRYELGYSIPEDPLGWKYYINLQGEYHDADALIYVPSLDTGEQIPFTKEHLADHRITRLTYAARESEYKKLVAKHPNEVTLIHGILRPVDASTAISEPEGKILDADPRYIEDQEVSLLIDLQEWIYSYLMRRSVRAYMKNEEYFPAARLSILYANLPLEIDNIRLSRTRTQEVHSYYVRAHLASQGGLDRYVDDLSWDQSLWLYRNISQVRSRLGHQGNFEYLVERLLNTKELPLHRYVFEKDDSNLLTDLLPKVTIGKQMLTTTDVSSKKDQESLQDELQSRYRYWPERLGQSMDNAAHNGYTTTWTRLLVSELTDTSIEGGETLYEYSIRHWIAYAMSNRLNEDIMIKVPRERKYRMMTQEEAALLYLYCVGRIHGETIRNVGEHVIPNIRRAEPPDSWQAMSLVDSNLIDEESLRIFLRGSTPLPRKMDRLSYTRFASLSYLQHIKQRFFLSNIDDGMTRAQLQQVKDQQYINLRLLEGVTLEVSRMTPDLREIAMDVDVTEYTTKDFEILARRLVGKCVDIDPNDRLIDTGRNHRAAIRILDELTSYQTSIQLDSQIVRRVCMEGTAPRLMSVQAWDRSGIEEPDLMPATVLETRAGMIDYKYVSPYTLADRLALMEAHMVGHVDRGIQRITQTFDEASR